MIDRRMAMAEQLKRLLMESSSMIEEYTGAVCPLCTEVCCRQKHGVYRERDILYLRALGSDVPGRDGTRPPEGPCEAMGQAGCVQPRWMRPFRCTWYFCDPLLIALGEGRQKKARRLSEKMREIIELYGELE